MLGTRATWESTSPLNKLGHLSSFTFFFFKDLFFCVNMCVRVLVKVSKGTRRGVKSLELELQAFMSLLMWRLGTELGSQPLGHLFGCGATQAVPIGSSYRRPPFPMTMAISQKPKE